MSIAKNESAVLGIFRIIVEFNISEFLYKRMNLIKKAFLITENELFYPIL